MRWIHYFRPGSWPKGRSMRGWRWWALCAWMAAGAAWAGPSVTVVRSTVKLQPGLSPLPQSSASISAARNEAEAFQILVIPDESGLSQLVVHPPVLTHEQSGTSLPASAARVYRLGPIALSQPSNLSGGSGNWPDPLIPADAAEVGLDITNAGAPQFVVVSEAHNAFPRDVPFGDQLIAWVEVQVPANAQPGRYTGTVQIESPSLTDGPILVPVTLTVWELTLPSTSSLSTSFPMTPDMACNAHMGVYCPSTDAFRKMNALYGRFFLQHRISVQFADKPDSSDMPGSLDRYWNIYGPLITGVEPNNALAAAQGIKSPMATSLRYPWYRPDETPDVRASKASLWWNNLVVPKGLQSLNFDYTADEPGSLLYPWAQVGLRADEIHAVSPDFRTMVSTDINKATDNGVADKINAMVPPLSYMDPRPNWGTSYSGSQRSTYDSFLALPGLRSLWMYNSCMSHSCGTANTLHTNWPDMVVDSTGLQNRAAPWLSFIYNVRGFYYYEIARAFTSLSSGSSAYSSSDLYQSTGNGDGTLVYPGRSQDIGGSGTYAIPVASFRLKMLREGLEDYEYLEQCAAFDAAGARSIALGLFPMKGVTDAGVETGSMYSASTWPSTDPLGDAERLEQARAQLVQCILNGANAADAGLGADAGDFGPDAGVDAGASPILDSGVGDAGIVDAGVGIDAGMSDAGMPDAGGVDAGFSSDSGIADAGTVLPPFTAMWTIQSGTSGKDFARSVAVDPMGQILVTGDSTGSLAYTSAGGADVFLLKRTSAGRYTWGRQAGTSRDDFGNALVLDGLGTAYVVGTTSGSLRGTYRGGTDLFITAYASSGSKLWGKQWGTAADEVGTGVALDSQGHLWIAGHTSGALAGPNLGQSDWVLIEVNTLGSELRRIQFGSSAREVATGVATGPDGSIYLSGWKQDTGGLSKRALVKVNSTGTVQWKVTGSEASASSFSAVAVDGSGAIYVTGQLGSQLLLEKYSTDGTRTWVQTFGSGTDSLAGLSLKPSSTGLFVVGWAKGSTLGTSIGGQDAFLSQHAPSDGSMLRSTQFGTAADDSALGLAVDGQGHPYVVGVTAGSLPGSTSAGQQDLFIRQY